MVSKNSQHIIDIVSVTAKGAGVGYLNVDNSLSDGSNDSFGTSQGFAIFVEDALPGDKLKIHILKAKSRYGFGKILEIITPSPHRIESPCPVSHRCGGCQWQNCNYQAQLMFKKQIVIDAIERIGGIKNPPVEDVIGHPTGNSAGLKDSIEAKLHKQSDEVQIWDNNCAPFHYRNKTVFPVVPSNTQDGDNFAIGMFAARSHRIVEVEYCNIQHPAHIPILKAMKKYMRRNKVMPYNELSHSGLMRFIMVRTSITTGEVMVVLVINGKALPLEEKLASTLKEAGASTVVISKNTSKSNVILGDKFRVISGSGTIRETIGDATYQISAPSFFQINPVQTKTLYEVAVKQAGLKGKTVIDAHVGAGGVSLFAAKDAKEIIGVDIVQAAIDDGIKNAEINNITNITFLCGASEDVLPTILEGNKPDIMFLDPPRKGCDIILLETILLAQIHKIVYISCEPATLARDIKILAEGGYSLMSVQPVDMFPHTGKVEVSCLLERVF